jgi:hypothetical protein
VSRDSVHTRLPNRRSLHRAEQRSIGRQVEGPSALDPRLDARIRPSVDPDGAHPISLTVEHRDRTDLEIDVLGTQGPELR